MGMVLKDRAITLRFRRLFIFFSGNWPVHGQLGPYRNIREHRVQVPKLDAARGAPFEYTRSVVTHTLETYVAGARFLNPEFQLLHM